MSFIVPPAPGSFVCVGCDVAKGIPSIPTRFPDGLVLIQPWPSTSAEKAHGIPDRFIYYQFRHAGARRTLRAIDEQGAQGGAGCRRGSPGQARPLRPADDVLAELQTPPEAHEQKAEIH